MTLKKTVFFQWYRQQPMKESRQIVHQVLQGAGKSLHRDENEMEMSVS